MKQLLKWTWLVALGCSLSAFCALPAACVPRPASTAVAPGAASSSAPSVSQAVESDEGFVHITPSQLALMLEDKDFLLINTHAPYGFEIEHTDAHIPLDEEGRWLHHYPADRATKIVLYCRSGKWSSIAAPDLVAAGYTNVHHLDGGMVAWHEEGWAHGCLPSAHSQPATRLPSSWRWDRLIGPVAPRFKSQSTPNCQPLLPEGLRPAVIEPFIGSKGDSREEPG